MMLGYQVPRTTHDHRLDPHAPDCHYRLDVQLAAEHGLFRVFDRACNCGYWDRLEAEKQS